MRSATYRAHDGAAAAPGGGGGCGLRPEGRKTVWVAPYEVVKAHADRALYDREKNVSAALSGTPSFVRLLGSDDACGLLYFERRGAPASRRPQNNVWIGRSQNVTFFDFEAFSWSRAAAAANAAIRSGLLWTLGLGGARPARRPDAALPPGERRRRAHLKRLAAARDAAPT